MPPEATPPASLPEETQKPAVGVLLRLAYDGAPYCGMAVQQNAVTVAEVVQGAVLKMAPDASVLRICSRTDSGVHAQCQYAAFNTTSSINLRGWLLGLTGHLPESIAVTQTAFVDTDYQPSKGASHKVYRYKLLLGTVRDPFYADRAWRVFDPLDLGLMKQEAQALLGTHDFCAFRSSKDFRKETTRTILDARVDLDPSNERLLVIEVSGTRFLHNMVRIIVGTLVDVGRGKLEPGAVRRALASKDRMDLGMTAPAQGLYLQHIELLHPPREKWPDHSASQIKQG